MINASHGLALANTLWRQVKLVDASFIWTEPHSMRLKTKLTIQGEVLNGAILQQVRRGRLWGCGWGWRGRSSLEAKLTTQRGVL